MGARDVGKVHEMLYQSSSVKVEPQRCSTTCRIHRDALQVLKLYCWRVGSTPKRVLLPSPKLPFPMLFNSSLIQFRSIFGPRIVMGRVESSLEYHNGIALCMICSKAIPIHMTVQGCIQSSVF